MTLRTAYYRAVSALWHSRLRLPHTDRGDIVTMICLHGVHTPEMEKYGRPPSSSVSIASLESNLRALKSQRTVISLTEAVGILQGRIPWRPNCAVLTFDDSLSCTARIAAPMLHRFGMTATVFVSTGIIGSPEAYWWLRLDYVCHHARAERAEVMLSDGARIVLGRRNVRTFSVLKSRLRQTPCEPRDQIVAAVEHAFGCALREPEREYPYASVMSWQDVRQLAEAGFDIGSHTVSHPNLALLERPALLAEMVNSKKAIESQTGTSCDHFCYPFGSHSEQVKTAAIEAGFTAATSTLKPGSNRIGEDLFRLRRHSMPAAPWKLGYVLSGLPQSIADTKKALNGRNPYQSHE